MPLKRYFTEYNSEYDKNANSKAGDRHVNQANAR
ncbi:hypothetical protein T11_5967 [Trichinella zimbabwensis]|uniref:Uncharacterized protein n=1 Tax=Trichinella zimbabwensis TaxID=268475 RepID=A0A0V1GFQ5_9BILA|nr:hypothetical protein T11_5967 [Trichinella zimbabwensis]